MEHEKFDCDSILGVLKMRICSGLNLKSKLKKRVGRIVLWTGALLFTKLLS
jgi:hypothetical protein